jgi:SAM-dependent methyltransferase
MPTQKNISDGSTSDLSFKSMLSHVTDKLRRRRFVFFENLLRDIKPPIRILDCGGTIDFTIVNLFEEKEVPPDFTWHVGDVRDLSRFRDQQFDVAFSNAVINLMPSWEDQFRMAREMMRVGKRYFVESPNKYFPIDWRTLVPFFHFLSPQQQAWCFMHFRVGTYPRVKDAERACLLATRVRDLSVLQMRQLFPGSSIFRERCLGFTKSIAAYGGWS